MQANCPQCGHRLAVDDARVPDKPFGVRCPKCQATVRFPGRASGAESAPPAAAPAARPEPPAAVLPPVPVEPPRDAEVFPRDDMRAQVVAQVRRELGSGDGPRRALVALPDRNLAATVALALARQGFAADTLDDSVETLRLVEQGLYSAVATARVTASTPKGETLYQRVCRLSPDARRRVLLVLVGDEFRSGDGTQAFVAQADLVLHTRDAVQADALVRRVDDERQHVYQAFLDARRRHDAAAG